MPYPLSGILAAPLAVVLALARLTSNWQSTSAMQSLHAFLERAVSEMNGNASDLNEVEVRSASRKTSLALDRSPNHHASSGRALSMNPPTMRFWSTPASSPEIDCSAT